MEERDLTRGLRWAVYLLVIATLALAICSGSSGAMPLVAFLVAGTVDALDTWLFYAWLKTQIHAVLSLPVFAVVGAWLYLSRKYSFELGQDVQYFAVVEIASCILLLLFRSRFLGVVSPQLLK